jgi:hypothetical protein
MATMSELTRQNLELWTRMQETMLSAFNPPPAAAPPPKTNGTDAPEEPKP